MKSDNLILIMQGVDYLDITTGNRILAEKGIAVSHPPPSPSSRTQLPW